MTKLLFLYLGTSSTCLAFSQPSFHSTLVAGMLFPMNAKAEPATYNSGGVHFGDHLDYVFGNGSWQVGIGGYIGQLSSTGNNDDYKRTGQDIARKAGLAVSQLVYSDMGFKSTQFLIGPVARWKRTNLGIDLWAKGGYAWNEPGNYSVLYKEGFTTYNIYVGQDGNNKNSLAYNLGAALVYDISRQIGLQIGAGYASTKISQVNYNFLREKGITPLFYTAANSFIAASVGLQIHIGRENADMRNGRSYAGAGDWSGHDTSGMPANAQARGRVEEDRKKIYAERTAQPVHEANGGPNNDSLFFVPSVVELRSGPRISDFGMSRVQLLSVNNYLTGFACLSGGVTVIGQCSGSEMPGEPIPGIDVRLRRVGAGSNELLTTRTNADGSFAYKAIAPGNYNAFIGGDTLTLSISGDQNGRYRLLDIPSGDCNSGKINYVITVNDKQYVEVIAAREASSGMATGREASSGMATGREASSGMATGREIRPRDAASGLPTGRRINSPLMVVNTVFEIDGSNIIRNDGKLYAEVITAREAGSCLATGRSVMITGDVDGDGISDQSKITHLHAEGVIHRDIAARSLAPRDAVSGQATGRRVRQKVEETHTPSLDNDSEDVVSSPLYTGNGPKGENPLFEGKGNLRVSGSNGDGHTVILPVSFQVPGDPGAVVPFHEYKVGPVRWMSPESLLSRGIQEKGISEKGVKRTEQSANTSLFVIRSVSRVHCADGTCVADAVIETGGNQYDAVITGIMQR